MPTSERQGPAPKWRAHLLMLGALCSSLSLSACLKLNLDYGYPMNAQGQREDAGTQESTGNVQDGVSTQDGATADEVNQGSSTDASSPTIGSSASSGSSSTKASTSTATDTNATTSSNSDSSSSDRPPTEPGPGSRWIPITVQNPTSNRSVDVNTQVSLTIDHADLVSNGSHPSGDDLRIYTIRDGLRTQLHRVLDPASGWGRSDTKIWFNLDGGLNASQSETDVYHLVLDPTTHTPLQDPKQVFLVYDDFNQAESLANWTTTTEGAGGVFGTEISDGKLEVSASSPELNRVRRGVRSQTSFLVPGVIVETSMGFDVDGTLDGCTEESMLGLWSVGDDYRRAVWKRRDDEWFFLNRTSSSAIRYQIMSSKPTHGGQRRYRANWTNNSVALYVDEQFAGNMALEQTGFTSPSDGTLRVGFSAQADGSVCKRASRVLVDWVLVRKTNSDFETTTTLRFAEEFILP